MVGAATVAPATGETSPRELSPDLLRRIVRLSLQSDGDSVQQWLRLSLVCKDWRSFLHGALRSITKTMLHPMTRFPICSKCMFCG